ncbi:GGDEF domain-containing protein [Aquamicrobium defluvii]|nr:GGDEF domain-containing protein [Aquamicrobium defluvii]
MAASDHTVSAALERLAAIVGENVEQLVDAFYSTFLLHEEASAYLSHSVVNQRLRYSLRQWLLDLVDEDLRSDTSGFEQRQIKIGEVHARLKVPNDIVMEGMTLLKTEIARRVSVLGLDATTTAETIILLDEAIDFAMRFMTEAYVSDTRSRAQTDEAFRLFSLGQDINLERETQRAALMEWSQSVLFSLLGEKTEEARNMLSASPFGLWVRHRAAVLFQGSTVLGRIEDLIRQIDQRTIPAISGREPAAVSDLQRQVEELKYLLNELFQTAANIENGRDPLTRTLNRRFLPSILGREISLAKSSGSPFTLLMVDVDHFKTVNDTYGHSAGDAVLGCVAEYLLGAVRSSDYVFRYGGEEFLIALVETDRTEAQIIAERIRQGIAAQRPRVSETRTVEITASVGVASFEGHPDYQYMINAADKALYRAKQEGRNRVCVCGDTRPGSTAARQEAAPPEPVVNHYKRQQVP